MVFCDGVRSPANIGSIFRICEAFGVQELIFGSTTIDFDSARLKRTARDTQLKVPYSISEDMTETIKEFRRSGYQIVALEITSSSVAIGNFDGSNCSKVGLIIGSERHGISEAQLEMADVTVHIELFGRNSSINVAHALGIALYEFTNSILS